MADGILEIDGPPADGRPAYGAFEFYPEPSEAEQAELDLPPEDRRGSRMRAALDLAAGRRCLASQCCTINIVGRSQRCKRLIKWKDVI